VLPSRSPGSLRPHPSYEDLSQPSHGRTMHFAEILAHSCLANPVGDPCDANRVILTWRWAYSERSRQTW
jgi:hypothetical protein